MKREAKYDEILHLAFIKSDKLRKLLNINNDAKISVKAQHSRFADDEVYAINITSTEKLSLPKFVEFDFSEICNKDEEPIATIKIVNRIAEES